MISAAVGRCSEITDELYGVTLTPASAVVSNPRAAPQVTESVTCRAQDGDSESTIATAEALVAEDPLGVVPVTSGVTGSDLSCGRVGVLDPLPIVR